MRHGGQMQRFQEQDVTELARIDCDGGPRIEHRGQDTIGRLVAHRGNTGRDLPSPSGTVERDVHGTHAPFEGAADKHGPEEAPVMLIDATRESSHALLIGDGGFPQVDRAPIRERQREANGVHALVAIEEVATLVMAQDGGALRDEQRFCRKVRFLGQNPKIG